MAMYVFDGVHVWGAGHVCGVGRPYGQEVDDEGSCGPARRRTARINNSGMNHGNRSSGVVVCGQRTKVKTVYFPGHKVLLVRVI
jgi:hypothetical protein